MNDPPFILAPEAPDRHVRRMAFDAGEITLLFLAGIAISATYAYYIIFSRFLPYDDEGYILVSLKSFFQGNALYDEVYSGYQPFFYVFNWLVFIISGATLCHDTIRLLTIALWLGAATLNTVLAYRLSRSRLLALLVLISSVHHLTAFSNEPGHPQSIACVLVAATVTLFAFPDQQRRIGFPLATGLLLGLLLLTKINVGVYVLLPLVLLLATVTSGAFSAKLQAVAGATMIAFPTILTYSRLTYPPMFISEVCIFLLIGFMTAAAFMARSWKHFPYLILAAGAVAGAVTWFRPLASPVPDFALLVTASACSVVLVVRDCRPGITVEPRTWLWAALGFGAALCATLAVVVLRGTSAHGLVSGLFWAPLGQSGSFFVPCRTNALAAVLALAGLGSCCFYSWARKSHADRRSFQIPLAVMKLFFGLVVIATFSFVDRFLSFKERLPDFWMLPFLWLLLVPAAGSPPHHPARLALAAVTALQSLVAYPIAGTQVAFATALMPVIGVVCVADSIRTLFPRIRDLVRSPWLRLMARATVASVMLFFFISQTRDVHREYLSRTPLDLPGASRIRLKSEKVDLYHNLVRPLARPEVETFLTLPGLNSLYFWAQKPPPTGYNVTTWMFLLDDRCQERIWAAASKHRGLMAVSNARLARFWAQGRPFDHFPLVQHINEDFRVIDAVDEYNLMVRR
jgi:hypothetical protein